MKLSTNDVSFLMWGVRARVCVSVRNTEATEAYERIHNALCRPEEQQRNRERAQSKGSGREEGMRNSGGIFITQHSCALCVAFYVIFIPFFMFLVCRTFTAVKHQFAAVTAIRRLLGIHRISGGIFLNKYVKMFQVCSNDACHAFQNTRTQSLPRLSIGCFCLWTGRIFPWTLRGMKHEGRRDRTYFYTSSGSLFDGHWYLNQSCFTSSETKGEEPLNILLRPKISFVGTKKWSFFFFL